MLAGTYDYKIVKSQRGKDLVMFRGYTYALQYTQKFDDIYNCSTKLSKCKAKLKMDKHTKLLKLLNDEHIHPPAKYMTTPSGQYVKL